jgi:hypothetical protein
MRNDEACVASSHMRVSRQLVAAAVLGVLSAAWAVPPRTVRPDVAVELTPNRPEYVVRDTVRAYQPVSVSFAAQAGDRLRLRLKDAELDVPAGLPWNSGVVPGPDGIDLRFADAAVYRLLVLMSAGAARTGRAAGFELGLRLRR